MTPKVEKQVDGQDMLRRMRYDAESGLVYWKETHIKSLVGKEAGSVRHYKSGARYKVISFRKRIVLAHRVAWFLHHGEWPNGYVDHINGDTLDNRIQNLRCVTKSQNSHNVKLSSLNTSGYRGVTYRPDRQKWKCCITVAGRKHYLGLFNTREDASAAYKEAADKMVGEYSRVNS